MNWYEDIVQKVVEDLQLDAHKRTFPVPGTKEVRQESYTLSVSSRSVGSGSVTTICINPVEGAYAYCQRIWMKIAGTENEGYFNEHGFIVFENLPPGTNHFVVQYHGSRDYPITPEKTRP